MTHNLSIFLIFFPSPLLFSLQITASPEHERPINGSFIQHNIPKEIKSSKSERQELKKEKNQLKN